MKPDKPGEWHSRDGRIITVHIGTSTGTLRWRQPDVFGPVVDMDRLDGDDWLPAEPPKFPELPPKPAQCYARRRKASGGFFVPAWWQVKEKKLCQHGDDVFLASDIEVVPHPDNDPAAVRLIEEAQRNAD